MLTFPTAMVSQRRLRVGFNGLVPIAQNAESEIVPKLYSLHARDPVIQIIRCYISMYFPTEIRSMSMSREEFDCGCKDFIKSEESLGNNRWVWLEYSVCWSFVFTLCPSHIIQRSTLV